MGSCSRARSSSPPWSCPASTPPTRATRPRSRSSRSARSSAACPAPCPASPLGRHLGGGRLHLPQRDQQGAAQDADAPHLLVLARAPVVLHQDLEGRGGQRRRGAEAAPRAGPGQRRGLQGRVRPGLAAVRRGVALREELRLLGAGAIALPLVYLPWC